MANVAVEDPAETVTEVGTVTAPPLLPRLITAPPVGASELRVKIPVAPLPPMRLVGDTVRLTRVAGSIVRVAVFDTPSSPAVTVTGVVLGTAEVVIEKFTVLWPAGTVTDVGTVADALLDFRVTTAPPVGAIPARVIVPVDDVPPVTVIGFTLTEDRAKLEKA